MSEQTDHYEHKPIDIREIFASKSPRMAKLVPGFVYRYIKRILHLDEINGLMSKYGNFEGAEFAGKVIEDFNVTCHIHHPENIPDSGRFIFASNHPLGGFDGMLLMHYVEKRLGKFKFVINDILMNVKQLRPVFLPVNKYGKNAKDAAQELVKYYDSDEQILIFPSGLASRRIKGKIVDLEWKKHFVTKAIAHKRDVIPVFISGRNSNWFYNLANLRRCLHLKWNIETFYLVDEMAQHRNKNIHICFGKPIPFAAFDKSKTHQQWADWVKNKVYEMEDCATSTN